MTESDVMSNADWVINCPDSVQAPEVINNSYSLYDHDDEFGPLERFWDSVVDDLLIMVTNLRAMQGQRSLVILNLTIICLLLIWI